MAISKDKKRYNLTLTPSVVERYQGLCRQLGIPTSSMSTLCDDAIRNVSDTFQLALEKGSIGIDDLFRVMARQMELITADTPKVEVKPNDQKKATKAQGKATKGKTAG